MNPCLFWAAERQSPVFTSWLEIGMAQTLLQIPSLYVVAVPTLLFLCITCEIQKSALQALAVQVPLLNFYLLKCFARIFSLYWIVRMSCRGLLLIKSSGRSVTNSIPSNWYENTSKGEIQLSCENAWPDKPLRIHRFWQRLWTVRLWN